MARGVLAGAVIAAALGLGGRAAAVQLPILRSARFVQHRVVVEISVGDVRPVELTVAKRRAVDVDGALLQKNVRLRETITLPASARGVVRWQSPKPLRAGVYFVQVTAVDTGGVTDCPPKTTKCGEDFSNVRRAVARKSS
jgi:hypothetical protein